MKLSSVIFILGSLFFPFESHSQTWFQLDDFPGVERDDGASFVIDSKAYCGSGVVPFRVLGDFYSLDLQSEQWDTIAPLPQGKARQYASAFSYNEQGYLFGGFDGQFLNDLLRYDPQSDSWTQEDSLPSFGRSGSASFIIDSVAYIIGGKTLGIEALDEVWAYDIVNGIWQRKNDLPFGTVWRSAATANDQKGYLAFGLNDSLQYQSWVYEYDPLNDAWTKLTDFPQGGRNYVSMHILGDQLIMIGGEDSSGNLLSSTWSYTLSNRLWKELDSLPAEGRRGGMSFQGANAIYYTTGLKNSRMRTKESWKLEDPTSLSENSPLDKIQIFPNPSSGVLNINGVSRAHEISIYTIEGSLIRSIQLKKGSNRIDLSHQAKGIYLLRIANEGSWSSQKLILD